MDWEAIGGFAVLLSLLAIVVGAIWAIALMPFSIPVKLMVFGTLSLLILVCIKAISEEI